MNAKLCFGFVGLLSAGLAGGSDIENPAIGVVTSKGDFQIDGFRARGNGTVLKGTTIDDLKSPTHVSLHNGTRFDLAPEAEAQVFADHLLLKKGIGQVWPLAGFWVLANRLRIGSDSASSHFRIWRLDEMVISVTSLAGTIVVQTEADTPLAQILEGETRELASVTGCLGHVGPHYLIRDQTTQVLVEVRGRDVPQQVTQRVQITGIVDAVTSPVSGASRLIDEVALLKQPGESCKKGGDWTTAVGIGSGVAAAAVVSSLASSHALFTGGAAAGISPGQ